ncbi:unnamed protein product [Rotaria sp. Silwood2]|nr:unnamed protein product [Rotaria sp. Silwood2]
MIALITKISPETMKYNINKIKKQGSVEDRPRSGQPLKINSGDSKTLGQWIRRNNETTTKELAGKLLQQRGLHASRWTVQHQLRRMGYRSTLPQGTPMLTQKHEDARVQWAVKHQDDDWTGTIFTDETCYQLFRNTIRRWSKISQRSRWLSLISANHERLLLCPNSKRSSYPECQEAVWSTMATTTG